uniref:Uncharacterized protein n=1 Tax=Arundo donax TaxID=35708 RepID=A0A0A8YZ47_ARUDO
MYTVGWFRNFWAGQRLASGADVSGGCEVDRVHYCVVGRGVCEGGPGESSVPCAPAGVDYARGAAGGPPRMTCRVRVGRGGSGRWRRRSAVAEQRTTTGAAGVLTTGGGGARLGPRATPGVSPQGGEGSRGDLVDRRRQEQWHGLVGVPGGGAHYGNRSGGVQAGF